MSSTYPPGPRPAPGPPAPDDPREIGGYRIQARLGAGGMGVVYLAHTPGGRPIALKAVREDFAADPEFRRRFAQEVASASRIHGLFTAQVVDHGADDPVPWLATAYVPGPSLQQVVERHGPLPVRTVLLLVAGIAEALQAIHGAGVVHRDLKPANVLIAEDGPRVIDFGIARAADATGLTGTGLTIGTAAYMAPEQALGLAVTPATDVFALGALAAYVAGGALPFGAGPESAALYRVVHEPADLSRVPVELHALLERCLAKHPEERPAPAELIAAAHAHPAVGPAPEFTEGWLPGAVRRELPGGGGWGPQDGGSGPPDAGWGSPDAGRGSSDAGWGSPEACRGSSAFLRTPSPSLHDRPTRAAMAVPVPTLRVPQPGPGDDRAPGGPPARRSPRRRGRTALIAGAAAVGLLAAAAGAVYYLDGTGAPSFTPGYADVELTAPDDAYEFDLGAGKVVPAETSDWYLTREKGAFVLPEEADAFVSSGYVLSPEDCERGIETEPVSSLPLDDLAEERPFCVRSPDARRFVIARLVEGAPGEGPVTVVLSQYRKDG
ncbi:protein kinase [Streptomyces sp. NPDC002825]|uniref:serine/threonine-protein kinase n=1 Tax=Streptomyces sp. NPDC002825 TaxID=3154666 RepID=UPI00332726DF